MTNSKNAVLVNLNYQENPIRTGAGLFLPNLGLDSIYTNIKIKHPDLSVDVIDAVIENLSKVQITHRILDSSYRIVGFSTTYANLNDALTISRNLKRKNPGIITVIGGSGAKSLEALTQGKDTEGLDYCVLKDGENIFEKIILEANKPDKTVYLDGIVPDVNSLAFPNRETFPAEEYIVMRRRLRLGESKKGDRELSIYTSKGCDWGRCVFCTVDPYYRVRSLENIQEELGYLFEKFEINRLFLADDNLLSFRDPNRVHQLCDLFQQFPKVKWSCGTRMLDITKNENLGKKILKNLKKSGCDRIYWGIESFDPTILRTLHKGIRSRDIYSALHCATDVDITSVLLLMYNVPKETKESLDCTLNSVRSVLSQDKVRVIKLSEYVNIPGSIAWQLGLKKGNLTPSECDHFVDRMKEICSKNNAYLYCISWRGEGDHDMPRIRI